MIISDPAVIFYLTGAWIRPGERLLVLYLNALPADSLLRIAFFGEMLQGHERRDNVNDFKEDWSMVRSASFVHPGGELRYGICNQGSLIGTQPSARPARQPP